MRNRSVLCRNVHGAQQGDKGRYKKSNKVCKNNCRQYDPVNKCLLGFNNKPRRRDYVKHE